MVVDVTWLHVIWPNPENLDIPMRLRQRTLLLLDALPEIATDKAPTFTLAHVYCPHPPFIFGENGEDVSKTYRKYSLYRHERKGPWPVSRPCRFLAGYRGQSIFITNAFTDTSIACWPLGETAYHHTPVGSRLGAQSRHARYKQHRS